MARSLILALYALTACAEVDDAVGDLFQDSGSPITGLDSGSPGGYDAAAPFYDASQNTTYDASLFDATISPVDAGGGGDSGPGPDATAAGDAGGFLGGLFGGGDGSVADAGWKPPPGDRPDAGSADNPEGWTLNPDSFKDCPALPPPIPIIGGLCAGVYFGCGWTSAKGAKYSCVCDWIHWLCI